MNKLTIKDGDRDLLIKLFEPVYQWVRSDGGDGFAIIVCRNYDVKDVANEFEKWQTYGWHRNDGADGSIHFYNTDVGTEESICFLSGVDVENSTEGWGEVNIGQFLATLKSDYSRGSYIFVI